MCRPGCVLKMSEVAMKRCTVHLSPNASIHLGTRPPLWMEGGSLSSEHHAASATILLHLLLVVKLLLLLLHHHVPGNPLLLLLHHGELLGIVVLLRESPRPSMVLLLLHLFSRVHGGVGSISPVLVASPVLLLLLLNDRWVACHYISLNAQPASILQWHTYNHKPEQ
jgi:hypothetical protein